MYHYLLFQTPDYLPYDDPLDRLVLTISESNWKFDSSFVSEIRERLLEHYELDVGQENDFLLLLGFSSESTVDLTKVHKCLRLYNRF